MVLRQVVVACALVVCCAQARAELVIDDSDPNFKAKVEACLELFAEADEETKKIIEDLRNSRNKHKIKKTSKSRNSCESEKGKAQDAVPKADGTPGDGCGTTTKWNPDNRKKYRDGVPRDPCASLIHELKHAVDMDQGKADQKKRKPSNIKGAEIDGCREENRYRKKQGLDQRTKYGDKDLPDDAKF